MTDEAIQNHIYEIDLHGINMTEAKMVLDEVFEYIQQESHITELHVVVGQGKGSESGPVLPAFVGNYIKDKGLKMNLENGVLYVIL